MSGRNDIIGDPGALTAALVKACTEFADEAKQKVTDGLVKIGQEAVQEVKELSPVYEGSNKNTPKGSYKRNWTYRIDKERGTFTVTVYVKGKNYRLTHLLEDGHVNRDGTTRSKAIPHVSIANDHAQLKADKLLEDVANGT